MILHGYWRSGTSYRTRIALNLKGVTYEQRTHDLRQGEQKSEAYLALNPQGLVPAIDARAAEHPAFQAAHPDVQPDADKG